MPLYKDTNELGGSGADKIKDIFKSFLHYYKLTGIKSKDLLIKHNEYRIRVKNIRKGKKVYRFDENLKSDYPYVWEVLDKYHNYIIKYNI